jgi:hypothetical protein
VTLSQLRPQQVAQFEEAIALRNAGRGAEADAILGQLRSALGEKNFREIESHILARVGQKTPHPLKNKAKQQTTKATVQEIKARKQVAENFYQKQGFDIDQARNHIRGIDFNKPVEVIQLKKGTVVEQWQVPGGPQGNYYAPVGSPPSSLGISPQAVSRQTGEIVERTSTRYVLQEDVQVLRSTATEVTDTWSIPGKAVEAEGGGIQFFSTAKQSFKGEKQ